MKRIFALSPLILFFLMLLDGHITTILMNVLPDNIAAVSRLLLLGLIFFASQSKDTYHILIFALIGLLYDSYYLHLIGVATTLFPIFASILSSVFRQMKLGLLNFLLVSLVLVFSFEVMSYLLAQFLGLGNLGFEDFVVKQLAPTLVYNLLQSLVVYPLFLTVLKRTRHKIVTPT